MDITQNKPEPVHCIGAEGGVVATFRSIAEAARLFGVLPNAIRCAIYRGGQSCGRWWRYAKLPAAQQPLRSPQQVRLVRADGREFVSIAETVEQVAGVFAGHGQPYKTERRRLERAIRRGRPWRGHVYRRQPWEPVAGAMTRGTNPQRRRRCGQPVEQVGSRRFVDIGCG